MKYDSYAQAYIQMLQESQSHTNSSTVCSNALTENSDIYSAVLQHETTKENADKIKSTGFKHSHTGIFFNIHRNNYSGGGYGGHIVHAKVSGPKSGVLDLEDEDNQPDDLNELADGEEIANYARKHGHWAWTDGMQFAVLHPKHIEVLHKPPQ